MAKDYYKALGVARNATKEDIKKAYRKLAHQYHPDKGGDEARFKEINEAYQILSDDRKRAEFDQFGRIFEGSGPGGQGGFGFSWPGGFKFDFDGTPFSGGQFGDFDFTDIFEDFMGAGFGSGGTRARTRTKGKDVQLEVSVLFEESVFGGRRELEIHKLSRCQKCSGSGSEPGTKMISCPTCKGRGNLQRSQRTILGSFTQIATCEECLGTGKRPETPCSQCRGRGVYEAPERLEIYIPRGIKDSEVLKMTGKGEASLYGGSPGDLYVTVRVLPHPQFRRQGDNIVTKLSIKLSQAILGDTMELKTLDGDVRLKIPEGSQSGDILKIRGKGAHSSSGYGRGDLLVEIKIEVPKKAGKKIREIAADLQAEGF